MRSRARIETLTLIFGRTFFFSLGLMALLTTDPSISLATPHDVGDYLDLDLEALMDIEVVTASKKPQKIKNVPATVRVITARDINERGYLTLDQALADLPGIQFRDIQGLNSYVFIRGVPNQNNLTLILVDGIQINELNSGGFYGGAHYNLDNVERIEVVYGPGSVLYGTNAVSGVINIITRDPEEDNGSSVRGHWGSFATRGAALRHSWYDRERRFGVHVAAAVKSSEKADLGGSAGDGNWSPDIELFEDMATLDAKIRYQDFLLGVTFQDRRTSAATYFPTVGTEWHDQDTLWHIWFLNAWLKHDWSILDDLSLSSIVYYRNATVADDSVQQVKDDGQIGYYRPNHLAGVETRLLANPWEPLDIVGGLVFENAWLAKGYGKSQSSSPDERPGRPAAPDLASDYLLSVYLQTQLKLFEHLQLTAGGRFDHSSAYDEVFTPRAGAVANWKNLTAKLLYAEAFRAPRPWDAQDGLGNAGLDPERLRSVEASLSVLFADLLRVEALGFYNHMSGLLHRQTIGDDWRWVNGGELDTLGAESSLELRLWGLRAWGSYTWTRSIDDEDEAMPEIAEHGATAGLGYAFGQHVRLNLRGHFLGQRPNPQTITATGRDVIDSAIVLYASLSFLDLKGVDLHVHAQNLLDSTYYHSSNRAVERYRQPQQSLRVEAAYHF